MDPTHLFRFDRRTAFTTHRALSLAWHAAQRLSTPLVSWRNQTRFRVPNCRPLQKSMLTSINPSTPACSASSESNDCASPVAPYVLYVVSTPIGNIDDISKRAVDILANVDVIAAEDTRRTGLLLQRILPKKTRRSGQLVSCHGHNWKSRAPDLIERLRGGASVAIVSDAGTPAVSDPGAELTSVAIDAGIRVVPVPGACAALAALVCAKLPPGVDFVVTGFIPRSGRARSDVFGHISSSYGFSAVVLYEAPHRLRETLSDFAALEAEHGNRYICLGREVTKTYEEFLHFDSAADAVTFYSTPCDGSSGREPRGEYTIVLGPKPISKRQGACVGEKSAKEQVSNAACDAKELIDALAEAGTPTSVIAKAVSRSSPISRKAAYEYATEAKQRTQG